MLRKTRIRSIYRVPRGVAAQETARHITERELDQARFPETAESARLLLGEIMSERLDRGEAPGARLTVDVRRSGGRHRWSVIDRGRPQVPAGMRSAALDQIADAWGVSRHAGLTRTWFELRNRR
jgi:hypothetical protein